MAVGGAGPTWWRRQASLPPRRLEQQQQQHPGESAVPVARREPNHVRQRAALRVRCGWISAETFLLYGRENKTDIEQTTSCLALLRCHQQYALGPGGTCGPSPPLSTLPGYDYERPLLPRSPGPASVSGGLGHDGPPQSLSRAAGPGPGPRQHGGRRSGAPDESGSSNVKAAKEFSIRIISV